MAVIIIYFLIVLLATTLGSLAGLGGGVIIKPLFDMVNVNNVIVIGIYSSIAVFSMSVLTMYKQIKKKVQIDYSVIIYMAIGSIVGGVLGDYILNLLFKDLSNVTKIVQNTLYFIVMLGVLLYSINKNKIKSHNIKNKFIILLIGLLLGTISVILGIGGGPLNLAVLAYYFSYPTKIAAVSSIAIIFFSQGSKIITSIFNHNILEINPVVTIFIIIAALLGSFIGTKMYFKLNDHQIEKIYRYVIIALLVLSIYNIFA